MLALTELSELSTLDDEFERLKLEARFVAMPASAELREASTLDDEFERLTLEV